nr:RNA-directed DNA polymerase, eukaryota, reverse transcriptase zinc-binding domain protein [Tanacetum cinerariifolium]
MSITGIFFLNTESTHVSKGTCKAYGTVVDVYIPYKKSKAGKRFAFVLFIKVENLDRLIANLCTIWIGSYHLQANIVQYQRERKTYDSQNSFKRNVGISSDSFKGNVRNYSNSFASVLKSGKPVTEAIGREVPSLVIDDTCFSNRDFNLSLMGKLKDITALLNLYVILKEEGSWFSSLQPTSNSFVNDERIVWISIEGLPLKVWSFNTFMKVASKWGELVEWKNIEDNNFSYYASSSSDEENEQENKGSRNGKCMNLTRKSKKSLNQVVCKEMLSSMIMITIRKKLQALKIIIRERTKNAKKCSYKKKSSIQYKLSDIDKIIDQGRSNEVILNDRSILLKELHDIISMYLEEMAQKAKVRWAIEEIKRAVWDCGINKSPGPDGFTFEFFQKYWKFLENDILVVVMEFFSSGLFTGIPLDNSLTISHLFYADDAIFVGKWDSSSLKIILKVLKCFHMASGLKININKSKLMRYGVHSDEVETVARYIGCATFVAPFSHIGVKVGGRMERINSWDDVVSKVKSWLSKWKLKTISTGGRLTLIKSVLTSIPLYQMSSFKVPIKVLNILESIRRKFFNGIEGNERKLALISWDTVLASKKYGAINGEKGNLGAYDNITKRSPWLDIVREINVLRSKGIDFLSLIRKKVSNGEDTLFWENSWFDGISLKQQFPRLYSLESAKHINVAEKMNHTSLSWSYRRDPRGGIEEEQQNMLFSRISGVILPNMRDRWIWSFEASEDFLVTSARRLIDDYLLPKEDVQTRWVKFVPIKINVFSWRVRLDKLPTHLNLSLRGVEISSIMCPLCNSLVESTAHLFFTCHVARLI